MKRSKENNMADEERLKTIQFIEKDKRYELWFMDEFIAPGNNCGEDKKQNADLCDVVIKLMNADALKELHVFIYSIGGDIGILSTLLQAVKRFRRTVAVNLGVADSCGWVLFFSCNERYASPHSEFLYHEASFNLNGKVKEHILFSQFTEKLLSQLFSGDVTLYLTDDEKALGKTTEVFLTGKDIIERGGCKDFSLYDKRISPEKDTLFSFDNKLFKWEKGMMQEYAAVGNSVKDAELIKYEE